MGKEPIVNRLVPIRRWTFSSFSLGSLLRAFQLHVGGPELVGRDLLLHEGGVGLVAIERLDHPIAIAPGGDEEVVRLEARGVGVAHQVEPVAAPSLAIPRRREQAVDELLIGVGRLVVDELLHLLRRGRESVQVEICAPGEGPAVGLGSELEFLLFELREDESVDGIADAAASFTAGTAGRTGFLNDHQFAAAVFGAVRGPLRAGVDPVADGVDLGGSERRFAGRHLHVALAPDGFVEQALVGFAGDDRRDRACRLSGSCRARGDRDRTCGRGRGKRRTWFRRSRGRASRSGPIGRTGRAGPPHKRPAQPE